tara:strand:- start:173 stop:412 length:240 start_codon:yes stop_codon:yes gene_type:complete
MKMFNVGDLVRFKPSGIVRSRYNPLKKFGIIVAIERSMFDSYNGDKEDLIVVRWMPWDKEERMMEFYLELLEESVLDNS